MRNAALDHRTRRHVFMNNVKVLTVFLGFPSRASCNKMPTRRQRAGEFDVGRRHLPRRDKELIVGQLEKTLSGICDWWKVVVLKRQSGLIVHQMCMHASRPNRAQPTQAPGAWKWRQLTNTPKRLCPTCSGTPCPDTVRSSQCSPDTAYYSSGALGAATRARKKKTPRTPTSPFTGDDPMFWS